MPITISLSLPCTIAIRALNSSVTNSNPFSSTAEAFNRSTGQKIDEDLASIRNRQNIQRLVLSGKIGEAIGLTEKLYPGLLETNPTLQFTLKVIINLEKS